VRREEAMAGIERSARVVWQGELSRGSGTVSAGSGAVEELPVTWTSRTERPDGRTSPEELIAAAHAACYAMAFSNVLNEAGSPPDELDVEAVVSADLGDEGLRVTSSVLEVAGRVPGMDQAEFERLAQDGERSCPVSNALRGNLDIRVNARLEE
jgi:osmotically inducible protein OsmC